MAKIRKDNRSTRMNLVSMAQDNVLTAVLIAYGEEPTSKDLQSADIKALVKAVDVAVKYLRGVDADTPDHHGWGALKTATKRAFEYGLLMDREGMPDAAVKAAWAFADLVAKDAAELLSQPEPTTDDMDKWEEEYEALTAAVAAKKNAKAPIPDRGKAKAKAKGKGKKRTRRSA